MMKEGRIFLYVSPNVLLPIMFLVMVITSLSVHYNVLSNTTWVADFWQGSAAEAVVAEAEAAPVAEAAAPAADAMEAAPEAAAPAAAETAPAE
jgi:light-harvesting protein B-800-850 alpha chain